uniref:8.9 kDa family member n=1 Tax=Rhipicephalus appendiculatus TaxID=34631 RepID=A0A131YUL9_RHIAP
MMAKSSCIWLLFSLYLVFTEGQVENKTKPNPQECKPRRVPDWKPYANCTYGTGPIRHGQIQDSGSAGCFGVYCWNGQLHPIKCTIRRPPPSVHFNYTRWQPSWPKCCYWKRTCKADLKD